MNIVIALDSFKGSLSSIEAGEAVKAGCLSACLWCAPDWLYNEPEIPAYLKNREALRAIGRGRMYGVGLTRKWMDLLGVKTHYVTKYGTQEVLL